MALRLMSRTATLTRSLSRSFAICATKITVKPATIQVRLNLPSTVRSFSSKLPDIATYDEIKKLPSKPEVLLIDVREPDELKATGVVPTSINIPLGQVGEKLAKDFSADEFSKLFNRKKPSADTEIIFMCMIGKRSQKACDLSLQLGYKNSRNYLGSWTEWASKEALPQ